jgi:hypothetical protein
MQATFIAASPWLRMLTLNAVERGPCCHDRGADDHATTDAGAKCAARVHCHGVRGFTGRYQPDIVVSTWVSAEYGSHTRSCVCGAQRRVNDLDEVVAMVGRSVQRECLEAVSVCVWDRSMTRGL